ncbi:MAG: hypothetical protein PHP06_02410 [Clostridia bacterium]|nr:hypothetical protein [Clostridia bacterium]
MKKIGSILIIISILIFIFYGVYQFIIAADGMPLAIKLGLSTLILGFFIVIAALITERIKDGRKDDDDDISKY